MLLEMKNNTPIWQAIKNIKKGPEYPTEISVGGLYNN